MTGKMKEVIASIKELTPHERATLAHCLISSLDEVHDQGVDDAWADIAEQRFAQLLSGEVKALTWDEIKQGIKR